MEDTSAPALLGQDPREIVALSSRLDEVLAPGFTQGLPAHPGQFDLALHDLAGKLLGQPVWRLWGCPPPQPVMLSWTVNVTSLADAEAVVEQGRQLGYRHFNLKVAPDVKFDVELARIVRQMAPECFLWADANGGYTLESAKQAARLLAEVGVDVLEAPLRPSHDSGLPAAASARGIAHHYGRGCDHPPGSHRVHPLRDDGRAGCQAVPVGWPLGHKTTIGNHSRCWSAGPG